MPTFLIALLLAAGIQAPFARMAGPVQAPAPAPTGSVRPGIEVFLAELPARLRGKRVGLITNHTGIDRARTPDIDLIAQHPDLTLVALMAPEHGIRGTIAPGVKVKDEVDEKTGVPVYSLYLAEDRGPSPEMLKDVDVLVYDLQEVGGRTWTYVSTMALSMKAAATKGIPFVVLDRSRTSRGGGWASMSRTASVPTTSCRRTARSASVS